MSDLDTVDALVSQVEWLRLICDMLIQGPPNELLDSLVTIRCA